MWRLKVAEGGGPWLRFTNNFVGRSVWEFDPDLGKPEERAEVEKVRQEFTEYRFHRRESSDLLIRMQVHIDLSIDRRLYLQLVHACCSLSRNKKTYACTILQHAKENSRVHRRRHHLPPQVKLAEDDVVNEGVVLDSLRRALDQFTSVQGRDGHWPGGYSGVMFSLPGLVRSLPY